MTDEAVVAGTGADANEAGNAAPVVDGQPAPSVEATAEGAQAPETYTYTMPDGIELDSVAADEFNVIAKELKLDQATAQKVADVAAGMAQRQQEAQAALVLSWAETAKADKEFGGDRFDANLAVAKQAMDRFGTPELRDVLNMSGLGNHPEIIRAFYRAGKAISEDTFVRGGQPTVSNDPAKVMFPTMQ